MHVLTNAEKLIPRRDAASLAESRKLAGIRIVTGTTSPFTRYERISVSPASCSIRSEYVIAFYTFKLQYKCNNSTPAWEQRKFGDCFEFLKSNTLSRAGLNGENGTARNVHYGDILIKFGDCLDGERSDLPFITDDTVLPKFAGSILREGDVIFADTAEDEAAGKCVELRKLPKEPTISGLHTIPARPRFPFGSGYLGHYLNSDAYHRQLLPLMQGIKVISVSKAALQDTQVRFPRLSEQAAIGAALSEIDNLITLHQRMCPIFSFCAHGSRTNFAQTLQGWLQILRYPRPIPKMLVSPSAPASGVFGTAKGAFICASSSAGASTSSPSARKNFITSSTLCCRESLSSP